jgi:tetratricopeptide (TPR) repeat protein
MLDQIAFVVMPFSRKATGRTEQGVPSEIDFDALWERVHEPVLEQLGYRAVRADRDIGALIIVEMIQRLAIADLVVADITLSNANVYYEVGVRHAAKKQGCALVSADWSRTPFDLDQMRQLRFPLADGDVGEDAAKLARDALAAGMQELVDGVSPVFEAVPGFPSASDERVTAFRDIVEQLAQFDADVRAVRAAPESQRTDRVRALLAQYGARPAVREVVALTLLRLVRDHLGFQALLDYIAKLPPKLAAHPFVLEQRALALSGTGDVAGAIGRLEELIERYGETSERLGLLGGRYKRLYSSATSAGEQQRYLDASIDAYERGMRADLNDYYPASNLARLYRQRARPEDPARAAEAEVATALACRAAIAGGTADEWVRATLLGNAFDRGDVAEATRLRAEVESEGAEAWKLESTIVDLRRSVVQQADPDTRAALQAILDELEALNP